ncbi:MAG: CotH kinase family protein [Planctomycetes bacterium]|nr:CotH kinase family protein [Planctomycetota bacterium]
MTAWGVLLRWLAALGLLGLIALVAVATHGDAARAPARLEVPSAEVETDLLLAQLVEAGALAARARPEVLTEAPPRARGILTFRSPTSAPVPLPSEALGADEAQAHKEREYVSIAIDPRDLHDPDVGIMVHPFERGARWTRGACVTLFAGGVARMSSTVGLCVHGDSSRRRSRKSLRLVFSARYGAEARPDAILPGARGDHLVLHSDWRRRRFVNPIGYEFLTRCEVSAPRTRPVRLLVNGELQAGIFFATEHLDESHTRERFDVPGLQFLHERDERRPGNYRKIERTLSRYGEQMSAERVRPWFDLEQVERWLAGILVLAPYDCLQGVAYRSRQDRRWRWIAWDVDWGLQPWPRTAGEYEVHARNIVDYLVSNSYRGDIRATLFTLSERGHPEFRRRLLRRVRLTLDHIAPPAWWREVFARYRGHATRLLGAHARRELQLLDEMERWIVARPEALRAELAAEFGLEPCRRITVQVRPGAEATIDGFVHRRDWRGFAFAGERITITAGAGDLVRTLEGGAAPSAEVQHTVAGDASFVVEPR